MMGAERHNAVISERDLKNTAYHEVWEVVILVIIHLLLRATCSQKSTLVVPDFRADYPE